MQYNDKQFIEIVNIYEFRYANSSYGYDYETLKVPIMRIFDVNYDA